MFPVLWGAGKLCNVVLPMDIFPGKGYCVDSSFLRLALSTRVKKSMLYPDLLEVFVISGVDTAMYNCTNFYKLTC